MPFQKGHKFWLGKKRPNISGPNHHLFGIGHSKETKEILRVKGLGNKNASGKRSIEQCIKISTGHKGQIPWNKGIRPVVFCINCGIKTNGGKKYCKKCWGKQLAIKCIGKKASDETRQKLRQSHLGQKAWNKGLGKQEGRARYPSIFGNKLFRESIKKRDNYQCQNCDYTEEEHIIVTGYVLPIHHIDYNKNNCDKLNLITVCIGCNARANFNKEYWIRFFQDKLISYQMGAL